MPFLRLLCLASLLTFGACSRETVVLIDPKEDDLILINGCVVSACNYLALVKTKHALEADFWTRILLVRYDNHPAGHAYCVWETQGTIYGYDRNSGGFPIPVYTRDPRAIAIVLSQELSKVMKKTLTVRTAEFIEPNEAKLEKYSLNASGTQEAHLLSSAPFSTPPLSLRRERSPLGID